MTIHELNALSSLTSTDEFPVWDAEASGEPTKKITAQNLATSVKTLASMLVTGDIANNLTTTTEGKVLDARQGKVLNDKIVNEILTPSASISIPASGNSVSRNMEGLTPWHQLVRWNFSSSAENSPPVNLTWTTYDGYFTITNNGGSTTESIRPVFAWPTSVSITAR